MTSDSEHRLSQTDNRSSFNATIAKVSIGSDGGTAQMSIKTTTTSQKGVPGTSASAKQRAAYRYKQGISPEPSGKKYLWEAVMDNEPEPVRMSGYTELHSRSPCGCGWDINDHSFRTPFALSLFTSPHVICTLLEMEMIKYGFQCCLFCPAHLVVNPIFLFTFLFWWPCMFCPRLLCDYTPIYWNSRQTCGPFRAAMKFYEYILKPSLLFPCTFYDNFCARNADSPILTREEIEAEKKKLRDERAKKKADKASSKLSVVTSSQESEEARRASQVSDGSRNLSSTETVAAAGGGRSSVTSNSGAS